MSYSIEYFNERVLAEVRALYCYLDGRRVVVLHAFVKKTRVAPERHLRLARRRMKEVRDG